LLSHTTDVPGCHRLRTPQIPKVVVKKEPGSPELPTPRHRPSRLNLSSNHNMSGGALSARPSAPLTSRESAGLALHDVGLACLSPGFNTQDPSMREQLERSMSVREQQRKIIEARSKGGKPGEAETPRHGPESSSFNPSMRTPGTSRRKGPPPGLSIAPPSHEQFAQERVIQSAPLHMSFPRHHMQPMTRQIINQPSNLSQTSHIHHVPANQTNNRLPPIADVFPGELQAGPSSSTRNSQYHSPGNSSHSNIQPPLPSPSYPPPPHTSSYPSGPGARPREFKSAEEAVQSMVNGREELLPRIVHYGGHQPPTPPSPKNIGLGVSHGSARRRDREEYERDAGSPPLGRGPQPQQQRKGPFGEERDSPETQRAKKEEFIQLCARAWDLFHS
ncbi:hypothetical protein EJ08DRAFT_570757, partial [Tothia fuscella]